MSTGYRLMSFVGLLSISGLALAVAVLVTVLSVMNGFEKELRERVLGVLPQGGLIRGHWILIGSNCVTRRLLILPSQALPRAWKPVA